LIQKPDDGLNGSAYISNDGVSILRNPFPRALDCFDLSDGWHLPYCAMLQASDG
jgi:hypothetical protein